MSGERITVFIVDDNEEFVASIGEFIKKKGYSLESAGSVKEALLKLQGVTPDLSFVDLLLLPFPVLRKCLINSSELH